MLYVLPVSEGLIYFLLSQNKKPKSHYVAEQKETIYTSIKKKRTEVNDCDNFLDSVFIFIDNLCIVTEKSGKNQQRKGNRKLTIRFCAVVWSECSLNTFFLSLLYEDSEIKEYAKHYRFVDTPSTFPGLFCACVKNRFYMDDTVYQC